MPEDGDDIALRCATIALAVVGHGDLAQAAEDVLVLPVGLSARGVLAAGVIEAMVRDHTLADPRRMRRLGALLDIAAGPQPATPQWTRTMTVARVLDLMRALAERETTDFTAATARLAVLRAGSRDDPSLAPLFDSAAITVRVARDLQQGDPAAMARLPDQMRRYLDGMPGDDPRIEPMREWLTAAVDVVSAGDGDRDARIARLLAAGDGLPDGELREVAVDFATTVGMRHTSAPGAGHEAETRPPRPTVDPVLAAPEHALRLGARAAATLKDGGETDLDRVDLAVQDLRTALQVAAETPPDQRVVHMTSLALGLYRRSELTNATADLREARELMIAARAIAGNASHPQWQMINSLLADIAQLLGDEPTFHRPALDGLQTHLWHVLIQPDLAGATTAARDAGDDAVAAARRCLVAGDPAGAIAALDSGRGLALFAATEVGTVGDRLVVAGAADLAGRWAAAARTGDPAALSADLRRDVMTTLAAHSAAAALLDPPPLSEIQDALDAVDADAFVYLVPGAGTVPGYLIAVPATGSPSYLALPGLLPDQSVEVDAYFTALARRDLTAVRDMGPVRPAGAADPPEPVDDDALERRLDDLCDWAWRAAMRALVETYLPRLAEPPPDRPRRAVLLPMGDLARIPWQAARDRDGRRAVEHIALSQAASARLFCRSARMTPVPLTPLGLIVGDPPDAMDPRTRCVPLPLAAARLEAFAVFRGHYRGARYLGHRPDGSVGRSGRGTADQVRAWLVADDPAEGEMLHLACHGLARSGPGEQSSYLLLADGTVLHADELIAWMARAPQRPISLVVLAACRTGLALSGYDEAYSLGTAFLAGGARSVVSTQWSVEDSATSALMFMFHHFLRAEGRPVWMALRDAQLWMLDPARVVPDDMPGPLRAQLRPAELGRATAWAAFVHWGL